MLELTLRTTHSPPHSQEVEDPVDPPLESSPVSSSCSGDRKDTQRKVLMQLQSIFAHLIEGRVQFHTPQGFWREFRWEHAPVVVVYFAVV